MFINRRVFKIKISCMDTAINLVKSELEAIGAQATVTTPEFGEFDVLALDMQFENLAAYETFWNSWFGSQRAQTFFETWDTLAERGGTNELWAVHQAIGVVRA